MPFDFRDHSTGAHFLQPVHVALELAHALQDRTVAARRGLLPLNRSHEGSGLLCGRGRRRPRVAGQLGALLGQVFVRIECAGGQADIRHTDPAIRDTVVPGNFLYGLAA